VRLNGHAGCGNPVIRLKSLLHVASVNLGADRARDHQSALGSEVAIYDQQLRSRFEWLRELELDAVASPPVLMAFDLLYFERRHHRPAAP
jgi:hypothetical protein